jgi:hypothetical protein
VRIKGESASCVRNPRTAIKLNFLSNIVLSYSTTFSRIPTCELAIANVELQLFHYIQRARDTLEGAALDDAEPTGESALLRLDSQIGI